MNIIDSVMSVTVELGEKLKIFSLELVKGDK